MKAAGNCPFLITVYLQMAQCPYTKHLLFFRLRRSQTTIALATLISKYLSFSNNIAKTFKGPRSLTEGTHLLFVALNEIKAYHINITLVLYVFKKLQRNISSLILEASKVFWPWCKYEHNSRTYIEWSVSAGNYRLIILLWKQCDNICSPSLQNIRSFLLIYFAITP